MKNIKVNECYISIGSNQGTPQIYILNLINTLSENNFFYLSKYSNIYSTKALHFKCQDNFINMLVKIYTFLSLKQLLNLFQYVENKYDKSVLRGKYKRRRLDIDILLYNKKKIFNNKKIIIPHIKMFNRKFIRIILSNIYN